MGERLGERIITSDALIIILLYLVAQVAKHGVIAAMNWRRRRRGGSVEDPNGFVSKSAFGIYKSGQDLINQNFKETLASVSSSVADLYRKRDADQEKEIAKLTRQLEQAGGGEIMCTTEQVLVSGWDAVRAARGVRRELILGERQWRQKQRRIDALRAQLDVAAKKGKNNDAIID